MFEKRTQCPVCGGELEELLKFNGLPLTELFEPWSEEFLEARGHQDQSFMFCERCSHGTLGYVIPAKKLYGDGYRTTTSKSEGASLIVRRFRDFIASACNVQDFATVIDIGANDGTLLDLFPRLHRVAIDPNASGAHVRIKEYFEDADLSGFKSKKIIVCSNTLEHIEDSHSVFSKLAKIMSTEDVAFFQFPCLDLLVEDYRFDQIHHQHVHYFSYQSIRALLAQHGFIGFRYNFDATHYGMLMVAFRKGMQEQEVPAPISAYEIVRAYSVFKENCYSTSLRLHRSRAVGYGAALTLPLLAWHIPALHSISALWDEDVTKHGLRYVNFNKRIEPLGKVKNGTFVVTAVNSKIAGRQIVTKLFEAGARDVIVPLAAL